MARDQFARSPAKSLDVYRRNFILAAEQGKELVQGILFQSVSMVVRHGIKRPLLVETDSLCRGSDNSELNSSTSLSRPEVKSCEVAIQSSTSEVPLQPQFPKLFCLQKGIGEGCRFRGTR